MNHPILPTLVKKKMALKVLLLISAAIYFVTGQNLCVKRLTNLRCPNNCISFNKNSKCYFCIENCRSNEERRTRVNCTTASCGNNQMCLSTGITGQNTCINYTQEGEPCGLSLNARNRPFTSLSRDILERKTISSVGRAIVPCRDGLVCKTESIGRQFCRRPTQTECLQMHQNDSQVKCDAEGNFRRLQCRTRSRGEQITCKCVLRNGTDVEGTERNVNSREEAPDCENRRCAYTSRQGYTYQIPSGVPFIDYSQCARCMCDSGEASICQTMPQEKCNRTDPAPLRNRNCFKSGKNIPHGNSISIGCSKCRCSNGKLTCLTRACGDSRDRTPVNEEHRKCLECRNQTFSRVCGNDGKTYPSLCVATKCRGLAASDVTPGPCKSKDTCVSNPCNGSELCIRKGGVTCLSKSGCRNTQLFKSCVNLWNLQCRSNYSAEDAVCGDDGNSYTSTCKLLQTAAGVKIVHSRRCDDTVCSSGKVCGTDGETYNNVCELQAQSANARVDYRGECTEVTTDTSVANMCPKIRNSGKCEDVSNCKSVIQPRDGCCRICGGGLTVGFDKDALEEYLTINPSVETVDDLMLRVFSSGLISQENQSRCEVEASLLNEGDLFIAFKAKIRSEDYCMKLAKRLEEVINDPPQMDDSNITSVLTPIPQELQFATVAESSPLVDESPTDNGRNHALLKKVSSTGIIAAILAAFVL